MEQTVSESETSANANAFIEDTYTRATYDGRTGIITEISEVKRRTVLGTTYIELHVAEPDEAGKWSYTKEDVVTWDKEASWLPVLADERGVTLETLDQLEGEPVFIYRNVEEDCWTMKSEHPEDLFDEEDIDNVISTEGVTTLDEVDESDDIEENTPETDVLEYESQGDYFVCPITELQEVERENACNLIRVTVDTPYDTGVWTFEKPYGWPPENTLVQLAEERGYAEGNFTEIVGEDVLVTRGNNEWELNTNNPSQEIQPNVDNTDETLKETVLTIVGFIAFVLLVAAFTIALIGI